MPNTHPFVIVLNRVNPVYQILVKGGHELLLVPDLGRSFNGPDRTKHIMTSLHIPSFKRASEKENKRAWKV